MNKEKISRELYDVLRRLSPNIDWLKKYEVTSQNNANIAENTEVLIDELTEYYKIQESGKSTVCDKCAAMSGVVFPKHLAIEGVNYPPFHPNCECKVVTATPAEYTKFYGSSQQSELFNKLNAKDREILEVLQGLTYSGDEAGYKSCLLYLEKALDAMRQNGELYYDFDDTNAFMTRLTEIFILLIDKDNLGLTFRSLAHMFITSWQGNGEVVNTALFKDTELRAPYIVPQNIDERWERNRKLEFDGFIFGQNLEPANKLYMGDYTNGYNTCGIIALYNGMQILGKEVHPADIIAFVENGNYLRSMPFGFAKGAFGVSTNGIYKFLTANDLENERFDNPNSSDEIIRDAIFAIMMYRDWDGLKPREHYIMIHQQDGQFHIYNEGGKDIDYKSINSIDTWVKKKGYNVLNIVAVY